MTCARLFLPSSHVALLIDKGDDFPPAFEATLSSFNPEMTWFRARTGKTTRAVNVYSGTAVGEGHQSFRYLTPQKQLFLKDLLLPPSPFAAPLPPEWIHVVCNTTRARSIADEMDQIREDGIEGVGKGWKGRLVWEPLPSACVPEELETVKALAPHFAVISPNLLELQSLLSLPLEHSRTQVEHAAHLFHTHLSTPSLSNQDTTHQAIPAIVVRSGELGSYTLSSNWLGWIPAYWRASESHRVVDPTGGGNGFLGGLCAGLMLSDGDLKVASIYASTAASFAIQQKGLPTIEAGERELWNGDNVWDRLAEMADRVEDASSLSS
ncbi:hypothetical protein P7C73_g2305, partial [Tremellales sp. Uapishka_1]